MRAIFKKERGNPVLLGPRAGGKKGSEEVFRFRGRRTRRVVSPMGSMNEWEGGLQHGTWHPGR